MQRGNRAVRPTDCGGCFGSGDVAAVAEGKDVWVLDVLRGHFVHIDEAGRVGQLAVDHDVVRRHRRRNVKELVLNKHCCTAV